MTRCLTDAELQAVADHEARVDDEARVGATRSASHAALHEHVRGCEACQDRVEEVRRSLRALRHAVDDRVAVPADLARRVDRAVRSARTSSAAHVRGATTMVSTPAWERGGWRQRAWMSGAAAAVLLAAAIVVVPSLTQESTLSAAEILGRSLDTMSQANGVEFLDYEVQLEGTTLGAIAPEITPGRLHIQQVIDYGRPGRYRVVTLGADGTVMKALAQDPERRLRTGRVRTNEGTFFFRLTARPDRPEPRVSPIDVQRAYLRAVVSVMQATADSKLTTVDDGNGGTSYVVQVPPVAAEGGESAWELNEARALIRSGDFLLTELTARGRMLGQPFGVSFKLVRREVTPADQVDDASFEIASSPDDLVFEGEATDDPFGDVVRAALKELAKARRRG